MPESVDVDIDGDVAGRAGPAGASRDSAIQYVAIDLLEAGVGADGQRALLEPVEASLRDHHDAVMRDALRKAFMRGSESAAEWAINQLLDRVSFDEVPEVHREEIENAVERRLEQKQRQLELKFEDLVTAALRQADETEELTVDWGAVV